MCNLLKLCNCNLVRLLLTVLLTQAWVGNTLAADFVDEINTTTKSVNGRNVIYELNLYDFTSEGTLNAAKARLVELNKTGVDIIWLMPIHPRGVKDRWGKLGSPYAVKNYKQVNPDFGTVADLEAFVAEAHAQGMEVWLDWVANHTAKDNNWVTEHKDFYYSDFRSPVGFGDVYQLNFGSTAMQTEMRNCMKYWIDEADIDGFRCDYISSKDIPEAFWQETVRQMKAYKPGKNIGMLAEADLWNDGNNARFRNGGWDYDYAWWFRDQLKDAGTKTDVASLKASCNTLLSTSVSNNANRMIYITNHDISQGEDVKQSYGDNIYPYTVLEFTFYGMPLIYNGQEIGCFDKLQYQDNRASINWNSVDNKMYNTIRTLAALKHSQSALADGKTSADRGTTTVLTTNNNSVMAYVRKKGSSEVLVVLNVGNATAVTVNGITAGDYTQWLDSKTIASGVKQTSVKLNATHVINLDAKGYAVFVKGDPEPVTPQTYSADFSGFEPVSINNTTFTLNTYVDGKADTGHEVKCYYTLDGSEPDAGSSVAYNGHVFSSDKTMSLKLRYVKGNTTDELSDVMEKTARVTYSTSENYANYRNNTKAFGGKGTITLFVKTGYTTAITLWAWDKSGNQLQGDGASWPGAALSAKTTDGWFYKTFSVDELHGKLSQNGNNAAEYPALTSDAYYFYVANALVNPDEVNRNSADTKYVYFVHPAETDEKEWTSPYCYAWGGTSGNDAMGGWPGRKMEKIGSAYVAVGNDNTALRSLWRVSVDGVSENANLIFNNGKGEDDGKEQMSDMTCKYANLYTKGVYGLMPTGKSGTADAGSTTSLRIDGDMTWRLDADWAGDNTRLENVTDWSGKQVSVNVPTAEARQSVKNLPAGTYMVQAIVRGTAGNEISLTLNGVKKTIKAIGMDATAASQVNEFGRVDALYTGAKGGWMKIEQSVSVAEGGSLDIALSSSANGGFQFSDVTLLLNPNTEGMFWTTAPTSNTVTSFDASNIGKFSFFDRGANLNAMIKADGNTAIGIHPHTVNTVIDGKCANLRLTDTDGDSEWTNSHSFGTDYDFTAGAVSFDRDFTAGAYTTLCLPFSMSATELKNIFGVDAIYEFKNISDDGATIYFTEKAASASTAGKAFLVKPTKSGNLMTAVELHDKTVNSDIDATEALKGTYKYATLVNGSDMYYIFNAENNGTYSRVAAEGGDIKPFRAYVSVPATSNAKPTMAIAIGDPTGIDRITADTKTNCKIYTLDGVLVSDNGDTAQLRRGIYIKNNRKVVVK